MRRVTLVTLRSPGLRAGKSPAFFGLARAGPVQAVADEEAGQRIFARNVASARSAWSGGESRDRADRGLQNVRKADPFRGDARGVHAGADELADGLVDGEQRPHFLGDARGVVGPQDRLAFAHVGLVVTD